MLVENHCVKSAQIRDFFLALFSCIRTRKNSLFGHFSCSEYLNEVIKGCCFLIQVLQCKVKKLSSLVRNIPNDGTIYLNNMPTVREKVQKHLILFMDLKLISFGTLSIKNQDSKYSYQCSKKLSLSLPHFSLISICKLFIRPHLNYGNIVYNQSKDASLSDKIHSIQRVTSYYRSY